MSTQNYQGIWDESYVKGGDHVYYPHEEIVRFINKYVRKRRLYNKFCNIMNADWEDFRSLDLGCGVGRHIKFLDEFGLEPYGIDLSSQAISEAKSWFSSIDKTYLNERLTVGSATELPYEDNWFTIGVTHSVLDSMVRVDANKALSELHRVLKPFGLMYIDLDMNDGAEQDEIISNSYFSGMVRSHFTMDEIHEFIRDKFEIVDFTIITRKNDDDKVVDSRAHLIIKNVK